MAGQKARSAVFTSKDPAIHDFLPSRGQDVDVRVSRGMTTENVLLLAKPSFRRKPGTYSPCA